MCHFEIKKGDNTFIFAFPAANIPVGELYDAAFEVLKKIQDLSNEAVDRADRNIKPSSEECIEPELKI